MIRAFTVLFLLVITALNAKADSSFLSQIYIGEQKGAVREVTLITSQAKDRSRLTRIEATIDKRPYTLAYILQQPDEKGEIKITVVHSDRFSHTGINELTPEEILSPEWQGFQVGFLKSELTGWIKKGLIQSGDELLDLLFFTYRGAKGVITITDEFDATINEALTLQQDLDPFSEADQIVYRFLDTLITEAIDLRQASLKKAWMGVGGWLGLDVITFVPKWGLKPISFAYTKLAAKIGTTKFGLVTARIANASRLSVVAKYDKFIKTPFTRLGVKIGLYALKARMGLAVTMLRSHISSFKMLKSFSTGWKAGKYPGLRKFVETASMKCGITDPEKKRLWLISMFYGVPVGLTIQYQLRGEHFVEEFDRVLHDVGVNFFNSFTLGRCSAEFDRKTDMTLYERWRQRQLFQHINNYNDTAITYLKMVADTDGMTDEELEELRRRYVSNFAYTLTRGPLVGAVTSANNGNMNAAYMAAVQAGDQKEAMQVAASEFITRFGQSMFSWGVYVNYRDGYSRQDVVEANRKLMLNGIDDYKNAIELIKAGRAGELKPFTPQP